MKVVITFDNDIDEKEIDGYELLDNKILKIILLNGDIIFIKEYVRFKIQDAHVELFAVFIDVDEDPEQLTNWLTKDEAICYKDKYKKEHPEEYPFILIKRRGL